ncbi:MAG: glycerate kinase [Eubacteriales bacterium]|nr:glycerate kinase [Eubacteriales bacterium]
MRIILAPDSYKGSLSATEIVQIMRDEVADRFPGCETRGIPVADGGEGTVDAMLLACGGHRETVEVTGPMGDRVSADIGWLPDGRTAVLEMAQASGLPLMRGCPDPMRATSYGSGELLLHAVRKGACRILMGLGGSATNDGGMGLLSALGARFFASDGRPLSGCGADLCAVEKIDLSKLLPDRNSLEIVAVCDVTNPLLGGDGATAVYGPQKGVTPETAPLLEAGMTRYADLLENATGLRIRSQQGAGAAGGVGAALCLLGAKMQSGIDTVIEASGMEALLPETDLVLTGEGRLDGQSVRFNKVPSGIARICEKYHVPVVAVVGAMGPGAEGYYGLGQTSVITTVNGIMALDEAMVNARQLLRDATGRALRMVDIGMTMERKQVLRGQ